MLKSHLCLAHIRKAELTFRQSLSGGVWSFRHLCCCSSRHTQECAQIRFMSPTHTLEDARCLRSCAGSSTDTSITCNSLAKTSTVMQARPFSFRSADHFRVTILKAIGAVERLARLEEPVQFHHKPLVYIIGLAVNGLWNTFIFCGKELHKFLYTYYQSCGCTIFRLIRYWKMLLLLCILNYLKKL